MSFVLDASVTIAWILGDEFSLTAHPALDRVQASFARVPSLWQFETASALRKAHLDGRLSPPQIDSFLADLGTLDIRIEFEEISIRRILAVSEQWNLSTYDASYLELARHFIAACNA